MAAGRITLGADGTIDPVKADKQWAKNSSFAHVEAKRVVRNTQVRTGPSADADEFTADEGEGGKGSSNFMKARTAREEAESQLKMLSLRQKLGEVVEVDQIRAVAYKTAQRVKTALLNIPARLDSQLAAESDPKEVGNILEREIRQVLEELHDEFITPEPVS